MDLELRRRFLIAVVSQAAWVCTPSMQAAGTGLGLNPNRVAKIGQPDKARFLAACHQGKIAVVVKMLIEDATLIEAKDDQGQSGFVLAGLAGHRDVMDQLKKSGYQTDLHESALDKDWDRFGTIVGDETESTAAHVNADHPLGGTAMWAAAAGGAGADIWRVYGVCGDPNAAPRANKGTTPLQQALRYADLKTAEMTAATLLSNDTDPNPQPNADSPPLHIAAERGSVELVEMLVRLGANLMAVDHQGQTAMQVAKTFGRQNVIEQLQNHQQIARTCRTSRTAYDALGQRYQAPDIGEIPLFQRNKMVGQSHMNLEFVQQAVTNDPRLAHSVATTSEICVEACAHIGRKPIVEFLLKNGAPYSLPTAVMMSDFESTKRLLDEDPHRIEERGAHDFGLLWYPVIGGGDLDMMQLLLDRGAKIEQHHYLGTTALHWACMRGQIELVELLIENGADVNRVGRKFAAIGETPLQLTKDEKIVGLLRNRGANQ